MLHTLLKRDGISFEEISDYKRYPIADNPRPQLSADRLEYHLRLSFRFTWKYRYLKKYISGLIYRSQ